MLLRSKSATHARQFLVDARWWKIANRCFEELAPGGRSLFTAPLRASAHWSGAQKVSEHSLGVIRALLAAHRSADWDGVRELLHPEARIGVFATGGRPADPEEALRAMREAHSVTTYTAYVQDIEQLDEDAFLLFGRVRYPHESGGFADVERVWVYVIRDGLLYRSAMFTNELQARQTHAVNPGLDMGLRGG